MNIFQKKPKIVTHTGRFHADDIFACATLQILLGNNITITRTRDEKIIQEADYVFDVGGIHDPATKRFDHHQKGGAGARENGVPYAAFGLVWKEYGEAVAGSKEVAEKIDEILVQAIDAGDNAVETFTAIPGKPFPFLIQSAFGAFKPTWKEGDNTDTGFFTAVAFAKEILSREIIQTQDYFEAKKYIQDIYEKTADKRLIILDKRYPWEELLLPYAEPLIVVVPTPAGTWKAETTLVSSKSFERRIKLPESWAGLRDQDLAIATGVSDAVFCHNGRFIAVAKSKEGALALAKLALEA
jgi:uncharacterized UPF0160 family protein